MSRVRGEGALKKERAEKGLLIVDLTGAGGSGVQLLFELLLNLPGLLGERSLLHLPDLLLHGGERQTSAVNAVNTENRRCTPS